MNIIQINAFNQTTSRTPSDARAMQAAPSATLPSRHLHRDRDFGIGYGNSSGYASGKRYADNWGNARFVCG